jgi:putative N6-adenine-specific DNA methylase
LVNLEFHITSPKNLGPYTAAEVRDLGLKVQHESANLVITSGNWNDALVLNQRLRTAHHVMLLLKTGNIAGIDDYYRLINRLNWEDLLSLDRRFTVQVAVRSRLIKDSRFAALKCKDAIADRMRQKRNRRPDSWRDRTEAVVFVHWQENKCSVFLDLSGTPLHKRGYRTQMVSAPLQESLAAALLMAMKWQPGEPFVNPMTGGGTLAIEAAMMEKGIAPGHLRNTYALSHYLHSPYFGEPLAKLPQPDSVIEKPSIIASDISPKAILAAKAHARNAGVSDCIAFSTADFRKTQIPVSTGVILFNPPYGVRLSEEKELEPLYKSIGDFMKNSAKGLRGGVFTGNLALAKKVGLKADKRLIFYNGSLESRLLTYDLY